MYFWHHRFALQVVTQNTLAQRVMDMEVGPEPCHSLSRWNQQKKNGIVVILQPLDTYTQPATTFGPPALTNLMWLYARTLLKRDLCAAVSVWGHAFFHNAKDTVKWIHLWEKKNKKPNLHQILLDAAGGPNIGVNGSGFGERPHRAVWLSFIIQGFKEIDCQTSTHFPTKWQEIISP